MTAARKLILASVIAVYLLLFLIIALPGGKPVVSYSIAFISTSLVFILVCALLMKTDIPPRYVWALAGLGTLLRVALLPVHPTGSDDYYRYLWDGKVMASGINPYRYAPDNPALDSLHSDILPARVNFAAMKTIYPPVAEGLFYIAYKLSGESFLGLKALLLIFELMTLSGIYLTTTRLGLSPKNILLYALCPLPMFQFLIDGHADGFGVALLVFSIYFYIADRKVLGYALIALSICVKPTGLLLLPLYFFNEKSLYERLKIALIPASLCALAYLPFVFSGSPFQALVQFTENWTFNGVVFDLLNLILKNNQITRSVCGVLFAAAFLPVLFGRRNFIDRVYDSIFILLIFSPVVHPWYLGWLAVMLPFTGRWSGLLYVSLVSLTAVTVVHYQLTGVWKEYPLVLVLEYLPVVTAFILEKTKLKSPGAALPQ